MGHTLTMPRYLSPEWVATFDAALRALEPDEITAVAGAGSLAASDGSFSIIQLVTGVPHDLADDPDGSTEGGEYEVRLVLTVQDGRARLERDPAELPTGTATIVIAYPDALALARGELDPVDALAAGRVRVRGDLAALVAGQVVLAEAAGRLGQSLNGLTDPA